jgi:hypothetical protein
LKNIELDLDNPIINSIKRCVEKDSGSGPSYIIAIEWHGEYDKRVKIYTFSDWQRGILDKVPRK